MGLLARRNEKDEAKYRTKVKREHDQIVRAEEAKKAARQRRQDRAAAARAQVDARIARKRQERKATKKGGK